MVEEVSRLLRPADKGHHTLSLLRLFERERQHRDQARGSWRVEGVFQHRYLATPPVSCPQFICAVGVKFSGWVVAGSAITWADANTVSSISSRPNIAI